MKKTKANRLLITLSLGFLILGGCLFYYENNPQAYNTFAEVGIDLNILDNLGKWEGELACGEYFSLVNETGKEINQIGRMAFIGDEFIAEDNNRYKIVEIDEKNNKAICKLMAKENIAWLDEWDNASAVMLAQNSSKVGIYMTHTDESYVPTDGTESKKGNGGILKVGSAFAKKLKNEGVNTEISFNKHDPHDANAYHRSRKTAVQLLKNNPVALIDVHRDGVPDPNFYKTEVDGKNATKIRLVIGRQNPRMSANLEFAKRIKAYYDKNSPGFIKGIYMGKGNYNQDLGPKTILIEVGTYTNSREAAEQGVARFAKDIPKIIGAAAGPSVQPGTKLGLKTGTGKSILWILVLVVVGGGAFLLLSTGSWKGAVGKLSGMGKEFSNYMGSSNEKEEVKEEKDEEKKDDQGKDN
ncbi:MAG: stage II sporulation protein P [Clostridia bacterium]|nr:stage II sporulation protein P [Clostridia bacterium]MDD4048212.1 stage II sporulation protein P [Clostridia bacterium]